MSTHCVWMQTRIRKNDLKKVLITSKSVWNNCLLQHSFVDQLVGQGFWRTDFFPHRKTLNFTAVWSFMNCEAVVLYH